LSIVNLTKTKNFVWLRFGRQAELFVLVAKLWPKMLTKKSFMI